MARRAGPETIDDAGVVIVDKAPGVTSHDVVSSMRKLFNTRRVGHAGTLDPMATGVLIIGVERATKMLGLLALETKEYTATIRLGAATDTDDVEGTVLSTADASAVTDEQIHQALARFRGDIDQVPAKVSAIKVDGRRAHALMRTGEEFDLKPRRVTVSRFDIVAIRRAVGGSVDVDVEVECSTGTYVRSLARDVGEVLGVGGHLTALRRTRVGPFGLEHARTIEELTEKPSLSLTIDEVATLAFPRRDITDDDAESISQGRWLEPVGMKGVYAVVDPHGQAIALVQEKGRRASSVMVVRPATLRRPPES